MSKIKALRVVAKRDSFRRAGYEFTAESKTIPLAELSKDAHAAIMADPSLVAHEVEIDTDDEADEAGINSAAQPAQATQSTIKTKK